MNIFDEAIKIIKEKIDWFNSEIINLRDYEVIEIVKALKLGDLYKELWERVGNKPEHLQNYKLEESILKQIKELENET